MAPAMVRSLERRGAPRFELELDLTYRIMMRGVRILEGTGKTKNISTSGILFWAHASPQVGARLEVLVEWPAASPGEKRIVLQGFGSVVRCEGNICALRMARFSLQPVAEDR